MSTIASPPPQYCAELTETALWTHQDVILFQSPRFIGSPYFYPVYRAGDLYSWSLLSLIKHLKRAELNARLKDRVETSHFGFLPPEFPPFRNIERVGGPLTRLKTEFRTRSDFVDAIAQAMIDDARLAFEKNPDHDHIVLVGGRDSLNLLLLPWEKGVIAASSPPNAKLVREFIERNALNVELIELSETEDDSLDDEVLINCCRIGLQDARWGSQLRRIANSRDLPVVIWKGQMADAFLTPYWRKYRSQFFSEYGGKSPGRLRRGFEKLFPMAAQDAVFRTMWVRGAMWQGVHTAIVRELTGCLTLSGYHGPRLTGVLQRSDLSRCVFDDVRPDIGKRLAKRDVWYPAENPSPKAWNHRRAANTIERWVQAAATQGVEVH